jgi:hypothetical protein
LAISLLTVPVDSRSSSAMAAIVIPSWKRMMAISYWRSGSPLTVARSREPAIRRIAAWCVSPVSPVCGSGSERQPRTRGRSPAATQRAARQSTAAP